MTNNNQCKNLIESSKLFVLDFATQVETWGSQFTGQHRLEVYTEYYRSIMYFQQKLT